MSKLERHIRRKWVRGKPNKFLPHADVLFDLIKTKDERIDPTKTLDSEKYFEFFERKKTNIGICVKDLYLNVIGITKF